MLSETQKRQIIESYINAYNSFDVAGMVQHLHPDIVFENISEGVTNHKILGISGFRHQAEQAASYFREREQRVKSINVEDDVAEVELDYSGVVAVDLPNGLMAGETISMEGKSVFYFEGDKIIKLQDIS
ncbi:nuclear transport factor 2 family protein [Pontibacter mangrovi]|uniref:Nuclear transport factor 2 family protein n=1 Tax=Pontibacter mangrovi TaxID=2589816 RepID=A0A501VY34_9BACT|nr:nuclear transport factor 2 family protein [Pontibacter mangrovi]TPE42643.1 nuclear transport factor 2 family protein [Pontibacter mangrovi]